MGPRFRSLRLVVVVALILLVVVVTACSRSAQTATDASPTATLGSGAGPLATPAFPVTLTDDAGRSVEIAADPQRIVSLAPSNTEIVCALGACPRLVGVTDYDNYPPEVADVPDVVIQAQVDVEKVTAADPDLVLAAGNEFTPTATIEQLMDLGFPVLTLYAENLNGVYDDVELLGHALGVDLVATQLVAEMQSRAAGVRETVAGAVRPRTLYEVSVFEGVVYTAGEGSFLASLIDDAGGEPITGDAQTFAIALEEIVAADPELILLGDATYDASITPETVAQRPGWQDLSAVREGRVVPVTDDVVITRPGPRIVDGLEALARAIHPERYP